MTEKVKMNLYKKQAIVVSKKGYGNCIINLQVYSIFANWRISLCHLNIDSTKFTHSLFKVE